MNEAVSYSSMSKKVLNPILDDAQKLMDGITEENAPVFFLGAIVMLGLGALALGRNLDLHFGDFSLSIN